MPEPQADYMLSPGYIIVADGTMAGPVDNRTEYLPVVWIAGLLDGDIHIKWRLVNVGTAYG